jgi:hypothetical protein
MRKSKVFLLKKCFCVSTQPQGDIYAVLNSPQDDDRISLCFNESSCGGCELFASFPLHQNEMISQLFQYLQ